MEENQKKPNRNDYLDENGAFKEGNPGGGRPKDTPEQKMLKKTAKQIIAEYKQALTEALPLINPVLVAKAIEGDMNAIKEVHDRTMDKPKQATDITTDGKELPQPLLYVLDNPSNKENSETKQED
jgi:hypothetical protein